MSRELTRSAGSCLRALCRSSAAPRVLSTATPSNRHAFSSTTHTCQAAPVSTIGVNAPVDHAPPSKPPSARPVETRKSQLIRTYTSLLRSTPLILFFQHSNLTAVEWAAVRRELKAALEKIPAPAPLPGGVPPPDVASHVSLQVMRTNMLDVAFKIVEMYDPEAAAAAATTERTTRGPLVHDLSRAAYETIRQSEPSPDSAYAQLQPLMVGPVAALTLPAVSPQHLAAALSVLSPVPGRFPAPTRKKAPGYHDPVCQNGLAKLLLIGGRVEGKIFDQSGVNWVGGIEGGLDGLRAQLVNMLQGAGLGLANALEGNSKSLWLALEGRKEQLEEEASPKKTDEEGAQKEGE